MTSRELTTRTPLVISVTTMWSASLVALSSSGLTYWFETPPVSPRIWQTLILIAAGVFVRHLFGTFTEVDKAVRLIPSGNGCHTERFPSKRRFFRRLRELIKGSRQVCVLNLTNPAVDDKDTQRFLRHLRRNLRSERTSILRYRRISSVHSARDLAWTRKALRDFAGAKPLEHLCFYRSQQTPYDLSFVLIEKDESYYIFFFEMLIKGGYMDTVLVQDKDLGRFVLDEFERHWRRLDGPGTKLMDCGKPDYEPLESWEKRLGLDPRAQESSWFTRFLGQLRAGLGARAENGQD